MTPDVLSAAAEVIASAEALLIGAGAGMSADSGLPVYRGSNGDWNDKLYVDGKVLDWYELSTPKLFTSDPTKIWGYYGRATQNLRTTQPHAGYSVLRRWMQRFGTTSFALTSNVDSQFLNAGFDPDRLIELHGNLLFHQCLEVCGTAIWSSADVFTPTVDKHVIMTSDLPTCPDCGAIARPNVLLFQDFGWQPTRMRQQRKKYEAWLDAQRGKRMVIVEIGAGDVLPLVRKASEAVCSSHDATLIRINPHPGDIPAGAMALQTSGLEALTTLDDLLTT